MVYYKVVKTMIDVLGLAEVNIYTVVRYYDFLELIIRDQSSLFTSKFWFLLCYFFGIKCKLSTTFHLQANGQIERIAKWKNISKLLLIKSRIIKKSFYLWGNLYIIILKIWVSAIHLSSLIVDTIVAFFLRMTSIPAQSFA